MREKEISDLKGEVEKAAEDARIIEERMHRTAQLEKQVIYLEKKYDRDIQKLTKVGKSQYLYLFELGTKILVQTSLITKLCIQRQLNNWRLSNVQ